MTSLLLLAQELFERATNPALGVAVNDEHAARLAAVLGPEDVERFAFEVGQLDDPSALTSYGWAWVLEFAGGHEIPLDRGLLADLCQRWDEPALKALVIEVALDQAIERVDVGGVRSRDEEWLDGVIERAAPLQSTSDIDSVDDRPIDDDNIEPTDAIDTSSAEALLTALLVVGTDVSLAGATRLLGRSWPGAEQLDVFVAARLDDSDPLAQAAWAVLRT